MQTAYQILSHKSKQYIPMYIFSLVLLLVITTIVYIPNFTIGVSFLYLGTAILFTILSLMDIYWFINYLMTPKIIIEINDSSLKINRKHKKVIIIDFNNLNHSEIAPGFLSVFMNNIGNIQIKTKDNKKIRIGYVENYTKINGQINSIKYIKDLGGNEHDDS
jgi:hypothetical protein